MHYTLIFKVSGPKDQLRMKSFLRGGFKMFSIPLTPISFCSSYVKL